MASVQQLRQGPAVRGDNRVRGRFGGGHQVSLFAEPQQLLDASHSAVDIFAGVLASVVHGEKERVLADRALLDTCVRVARAARDGFDGVQLEGIAGLSSPLVVRRDDVAKIELLRDETPGPKAVRVSGTLDTISATKSDVVLGDDHRKPRALDRGKRGGSADSAGSDFLADVGRLS